MIRAFAKLALIAALAAAAAPPARAEYRLSDRDRADVARIEKYLNGIETIRSRFVQLSSGGRSAEGTLYIERPNRLRLDYDKPATQQVYADGTWLIHVDTELESVTHVPLDSTIAGFLIRGRIKLSGDITVERVMRHGDSISLELVRTGEPDQGRFTVTLADHPLRLQKWTVVDTQGVTTRVSLVAPKFNVPVPDKVFEFDEWSYGPDIRE